MNHALNGHTYSDIGLCVIILLFFYTEGFDLGLEVAVPWLTWEGKLQMENKSYNYPENSR